jgi:hypothetical protein
LRRSRFFVAALLAVAIVSHAGRARAADEDPEMDRWRAFMPVFAPGAIAFLVSYVPSFIAAVPAAFHASGGWFHDPGDIGGLELAIPIAGPLLFADSHPRDAAINPHGNALSPTMSGLMLADGIAQAGGAALMLVGVAAGHRERDEHVQRVEKTAERKPTFMVLPMVGAGTVGVSARVLDW